MSLLKLVPKRVMVVFGTRPEAIKLAPVIHALQSDPRFTPIIVASGQHREMVAPLLNWFNIQPHHTLNVMEPGQPLAKLSGKLLSGLAALIEAEQPDIMMVQGDTTTAFMGALAGYYGYDYFVRNELGSRRTVQIAHVEAGLRTGDNYAPFPEEANRKMVASLAHWHFAPTATAAHALYQENVAENIFITGNTVTDALFWTVNQLKSKPQTLPTGLHAGETCVLITSHRRENYGEGLQHIANAIKTLAKRYPSVKFVYPVHLNQHVQGPVHAMLGGIPNILLTQPSPYPEFVNLMHHSHLILTDSGGLQEEGPALGKPVLVMRDLTERPEGLQSGTAKLVGTNEKTIVQAVSELLDNPAAYAAMAGAVNPYGDGKSSQRILNLLAGEPAQTNTFTAGFTS